MASFTFTLATTTAAPIPAPVSQQDRFFGRDLWFKEGDYSVNPAGDWLTVEGVEAIKQSLIRRLITSPGEWQTVPEFGVGARDFIKSKNTPASRQELVNRIEAQYLRDPRVAAVREVVIDTEEVEDGLKISIKFGVKGEPTRNQPRIISVEVT